VLIEEIETQRSSLVETNGRNDWKDNWKKALSNCFQKVDDEIEVVAPETAGSTAVVALLSQTQIIVANCGDSRAVLYRGKEAIALSSDHKVRHFIIVSQFFR
jgi:protein phosphatase 2C